MTKVKNPGEPAGEGEVSRDQLKQSQQQDSARHREQEVRQRDKSDKES